MLDKAIRTIVVLGLACIFGLIGARIPTFGEDGNQFAWPGFFGGTGIVLLAYLISRPFVAPGERSGQQGTRIQRAMLRVAVLSFIGALISFTTFLYASWVWPRIAIYLTVIVGAVAVFAGLISVWLGPRPDKADS